MTPQVADQIDRLRQRIEQELVVALNLSDACPERLHESMHYSLLAGGKRLRPVLVLLACEACGGLWEQALPAACAIEMIHTYSLVHDDLPAMDNDDLRRGRPTNHIQFDEATAILAGDGLLTRAFEWLATQLTDKQVAAACCVDLANAAGPEGMVGGQMADLEAESAGIASVDHLEAIHRRKTGRLLCSALTMGGRIAGADAETRRQLVIYGDAVGLAFQIADDLLDVTGDVQKMGKGVQKDSDHGKLTYPALLGLDASRQRAELLIARAHDAIAGFGTGAAALHEIADYVIRRDH